MNVIAPPAKLLVIGATGSIGRLVVAEALHEGYRVRALVRAPAKAQRVLPPPVELAVGDVTQPETLTSAVDGVNAIVFTHGCSGRLNPNLCPITAASTEGDLAARVRSLLTLTAEFGHERPVGIFWQCAR